MPSHTAILGTLDQLSPATYINFSWFFSTSDPDSAVQSLKDGVQKTVEQLPFLSGKIYNTTEDGRSYTVISWSDETPHVELEDITASDMPTYAELEQKHVPLSLLGHNLRPLESRDPKKFPRLSALASSYAKLDGGLIWTIAMHHQLMDGGGIDILFDILARNTRGEKVLNTIDPLEPLGRKDKFEAMINQVTTQDSPLPSIPTLTQPTFESQTRDTPFATLLFRFSIKALDKLRDELVSQTTEKASINTIISALLWYVVSRTQIKRLKETEKELDISQISSMLLLSKGMRGPFMGTGNIGNEAWIGNSNMMCMPPAVVPYSWLDAPVKEQHAFPDVLPKIADLITQSVATTSLELVAGFLKQIIKSSYEAGFDFTSLLNDTPLYRPQNFVSTSTSAFQFYPNFGPKLGRPKFVRPLAASLDGVSGAVIVPRKRADHWSEEEKNTLEIMMGLDERDVDTIVHNEWLRPLLLSDPE